MKLFSPAQWSLSRKFFLIVLLILLIPLASVGLLKEIEKTLVKNLTDNLLLSARLIGNQLSLNEQWFNESILPNKNNVLAKELFVFPLQNSFNLDGYFDDWQAYQQHRQYFKAPNNFISNSKNTFNSKPKAESLSVLLGSFENHLILSIQIKDENIIYPSANDNYLSDQIEIEFYTRFGIYQKLILSPESIGNIPVKIKKNDQLEIDWRYKAYWVENEEGVAIELKFPASLKPNKMRIVHNNVDYIKANKYQSSLSTSRHDYNQIVWPSKKIVDFVSSVQLTSAQRLWVIDVNGRVLSSNGDLNTSAISFSSNPLLNWVLASQSELMVDPRKNNLHLNSKEIYLAQKGIASTRVESLRNTEQSIALAAFPIMENEHVFGVLLLEENIARIQVLQKKALLNMFLIISVVFILIIWVLFWYVSRMVTRIKKLNSSIGKVVDHQGRMSSPILIDFEEGDEIDDLYKGFSNMATRLYEYNDHLEKLASRLSHELRTPIAIVRSSLDNLLLSCHDEEDRKVIDRALKGNQRLGTIITRMRQASGVKEAMQNAEKEKVDFVKYLEQVISGYQLTFQSNKFELNTNNIDCVLMISADLFSEMLDKLISNAIEFSKPTHPIKIELNQQKNKMILSLSNDGICIPQKNLKKIFHSLVSIRTSQQSTGTHLGLGLYVVRLISDFHGFGVKAFNREDGSGVVFSITIPTPAH